jgi:SAM-dependent methyltransferase
MKNKKNVISFNKDVENLGGYQYLTGEVFSSTVSAKRLNDAIHKITDWNKKTIIDVGCGDGKLTKNLIDYGATSVVGIDPADKAVERASQDYSNISNLKFLVGSAYQIPYADKYFDIAIIRGVLHHLQDPQLALLEASRIAKEVIVLEPNGLNPVLKLIEKISPYHIEHEERSFLPVTLKNWGKNAGLKLEKIEYINLVPVFCPTSIVKLLKKIEPIVEVTFLKYIVCGQLLLRFKSQHENA